MLNGEWIKSSWSGNQGNCVEVRLDGETVQVRDSKNSDGPVLTFTHDEWVAFTGGAKDGEFDLRS